MKCIILWILVGILVFFLMHERVEGLTEPPQAPLAQPKQVSFISGDASTSTTANPFLAQPDYRDWWEARDSFRYFLDIYTPQKAKLAGVSDKANRMLLQAPQALSLIQAYIRNPDAIPSRTILREGRQARQIANEIRRIGPMQPNDFSAFAPLRNRNDNLLA